MIAIIENVMQFLALWGRWFFAALLILSLVGLFRLGRGHRFWLPPTWKARIAMVLLVPLAGFSVFFLVALPAELSEFFAGIRRIDAMIGQEAADVDFRLVSDDTGTSLYGVRGEVTLVNLWATWCPPCVQELPELDKLQDDYADRGLVVVTLSQEEREHLLEFAAKNPFDMTNVYAETIGWLDVGPSRPVTVMIDGDGVVRDLVIGGRDYEGFEEMVRPYLGGA